MPFYGLLHRLPCKSCIAVSEQTKGFYRPRNARLELSDGSRGLLPTSLRSGSGSLVLWKSKEWTDRSLQPGCQVDLSWEINLQFALETRIIPRRWNYFGTSGQS